ncbi:probable glycosyltransferase At3g07620 isoform X1 [Trifolium pratense]|uniref:probable glycosyltransferase At3g07620 isoform X1 n=2 Tax=Trifolium pratense TaxID=57577 RepID=UPI001E696A20|nr:probable glycosyltransferase At3g07620 isoform X1 [Trifolium pratense]XP_045822593.1 probable glycosyltransferase At3g07620 isoform X1 [Trifolium pratense]
MFQCFHELCHMGNRRLLFLLAALGVNYLLFQSILVPYAMVEKVNIPIIEEDEGMHNYANSSLVFDGISELEKKDVGKNNSLELDNVGSKESFMAIFAKESKVDFPVKRFFEAKRGISTISLLEKSKNVDFGTSQRTTSSTNSTHLEKSPQKIKLFASGKSTAANVTVRKMRCNMPPKSRMLIHEMNHLLERRRVSSRAMKPRWSSKLDMEILAARSEIEHAPTVTHDKELYAPLFRNHSMFKRSYELMERTLKVYIYMEGNKPIFHQPILKGLYASEGWFMKLMEENKQFVVKDPAKAHLFYMPFSSRMLEFSVYVRNSHNRTNLRQYLKEYTDKISAKYRYFNRTGGADHFLVACHDWAPYETRHHMEYCIKALCNSDVTQGFKIGRDVSLPETMIRSVRNPQRDLGGKPPQQRTVLAFFAGNMHGYLRPILLKHWKDKDPDMKIFGPMPHGVANKMNYIQHMKNSKYCICPKGYEVNSPRVVEAMFYECVPVIISDNFVPPFFEVLNWDAFSLILAEKDIPNLKQILLSVPEEKYLKLQLGVRRVQKHFLWHTKPLKYDLFHMTLHSIWYNRVFQINVRK